MNIVFILIGINNRRKLKFNNLEEYKRNIENEKKFE